MNELYIAVKINFNLSYSAYVRLSMNCLYKFVTLSIKDTNLILNFKSILIDTEILGTYKYQ